MAVLTDHPAAPDEPCEVPDADAGLPQVPEPAAGADECGRPVGRLRRVLKVAVPVLIGGAVVAVVAGFAGDAGSMVRALRRVSVPGLGLAVGAEVASFVFLGLHLRALGGPGGNARRLAPFRIGTIVFGLGSVMPAAPAEGLVMAGSVLRHRRLAHRRTVLVLGVSQFFGTTGLYALAAVDALAVVLSAHDGPLQARPLLVGGGVGTLAVLGLLGLALSRRKVAALAGQLSGRIRRLRHPEPVAERRARGEAWHDAVMHVVAGGRRAPWLALTILFGWGLDGTCLFLALRAVGVRVDLDVLLLAYSVSAAACLIPFLPAGLGVVETLTPAVLHLYGVPIEAALAGLLVYRAVGTFGPAAVGALSLVTLRVESAPGLSPAEEAAEHASAPGLPAPG